ncbi:MAG TPA: saccharopine dehydrogenase NADP-binding domain-containing protein [Allosphingosinicella sp.]|jgi:saccharopine dehydrogenase-like NADP-dependent oxidoreductase
MKKNILLVGGGKIGAKITHLLANSGDYRVTVADSSAGALSKVAKHDEVETLQLDVTNETALSEALSGKFAVLSAVPFSVTRHVANGAVAAKVHYFDLTEDVATTRHVKKLEESAQSVLMPQCGLAPGFIAIAGHHLAKSFDTVDELRLRVGALTLFPTNRLKYNLTWSTAGLIHEYLEKCEAIVDGEVRELDPLEGHERFSLDGIDYEAFNTSGGLGTLCERMGDRVRNLNYKTIRYPGHCEILKLLIDDLGLGKKPDLLVQIFDEALPLAYQDVVLVFASVTGRIGGELRQVSDVRKIYSRLDESGRRWSGIQITTASAICAVLDLVAEGRLPQAGFIHHDQVDFDEFIANRFGRNYAAAEPSPAA